MTQIKLTAGDATEDLVAFITNELPDEVLDETEIEREHAKDFQVASEPITVGVLMTLTPLAVISVARLVEKWLESRRQQEQIKLAIQAFGVSDEAGKAIAQIAQKHADVSISYGMPQPPSVKS